jgi:hypothetical protein
MFLETQTAICARRARLEVESRKDAKWIDEYRSFCGEFRDIGNLANSNYWMLGIRYVLSKLCLRVKWLMDSVKEWSIYKYLARC